MNRLHLTRADVAATCAGGLAGLLLALTILEGLLRREARK